MSDSVSAKLMVAAAAAICLAGPAWTQTVVRSQAINWDFSGGPFPRYKGGNLVAYDSDQATLRVFDKSGVVEKTAKLTLPGAVRVMVGDLAVGPNGELVAAASAQDGEGHGTSVIAWMDRSGQLLRVVRTAPFAPFHIVFAKDGTLWAVGRVYDAERKNTPSHDIIRLYDQQGRLVKSLLPSDSFTKTRWHPARDSFLIAGADRMGLYSITATEWVEMSLAGAVLTRCKTSPPPTGTALMGAALTSSGNLYLSGFYRPDTVPGSEKNASPGSLLFRLSKSDGRLEEVDGSPVTGVKKDVLLLAADGQQLVFYRKSPRGLDWVELP